MDALLLKVGEAVLDQGLTLTILAIANVVQFKIIRSLASKYEDCLRGSTGNRKES